MYSITLLTQENSYCSYSVERRFFSEESFFKALYKIADTHNCLGYGLIDTIKFLSSAGYVITLPRH